MRFAFVVLHYMTVEETAAAVESILALDSETDPNVIVVDNASPNGSGMLLEEMYEREKRVFVVPCDENIGFARGNDLGIACALDIADPDFVVVMNNDAVIRQSDFMSLIEEEHLLEPFDVLGPDIWVPDLNYHQSPKRLSTYTKAEVESLLSSYELKMKRKSLGCIKNALKRLPGVRGFVLRIRKSLEGIDWRRACEGVPLHGACVIFSRRFLSEREFAFNPNTFMYFEMEILDYECKRGGFREVYRPHIRVEHHHNVSTEASYKSDSERVRFMQANIIKSLNVFLDMIDSYER